MSASGKNTPAKCTCCFYFCASSNCTVPFVNSAPYGTLSTQLVREKMQPRVVRCGQPSIYQVQWAPLPLQGASTTSTMQKNWRCTPMANFSELFASFAANCLCQKLCQQETAFCTVSKRGHVKIKSAAPVVAVRLLQI